MCIFPYIFAESASDDEPYEDANDEGSDGREFALDEFDELRKQRRISIRKPWIYPTFQLPALTSPQLTAEVAPFLAIPLLLFWC